MAIFVDFTTTIHPIQSPSYCLASLLLCCLKLRSSPHQPLFYSWPKRADFPSSQFISGISILHCRWLASPSKARTSICTVGGNSIICIFQTSLLFILPTIDSMNLESFIILQAFKFCSLKNSIRKNDNSSLSWNKCSVKIKRKTNSSRLLIP